MIIIRIIRVTAWFGSGDPVSESRRSLKAIWES